MYSEKEVVEAVIKCQNGQIGYFSVVFDQFHEKIYQFIYFRTHHKATAEDITSTVFFKALEKISTYDSKKASFSTWLYKIAKNSLIDFYRAHKENSSIEDAWDVPMPGSVEREAESYLKLEKVKEFLKVLPDAQRDIVIMRVWEGLSHKEIAEIMDLSESGVKMSFSRSIQRLNKEMSLAVFYLIILGQLWKI